MNSFPLVSDQEGPWNIAMEVAGRAAEDESNATKSHCSDQAECWSGKEKATPGYDST